MRRRKIFIIIGGSLIVGLFILAAIPKPKINLSIDVAPKDATVVLNNGKKLKIGGQHIKSGTYTITAQLNGFSSASQKITVTSGGVARVSLLLNPNSAIGEAYLRNNPSEALHREALGGKKKTLATQKAIDTTPLIAQLPYIGAGYEFEINYQTSAGGNPKIVISATTSKAKQDAVDWITNQGFDITKLSFIYSDEAPGAAR